MSLKFKENTHLRMGSFFCSKTGEELDVFIYQKVGIERLMERLNNGEINPNLAMDLFNKITRSSIQPIEENKEEDFILLRLEYLEDLIEIREEIQEKIFDLEFSGKVSFCLSPFCETSWIYHPMGKEAIFSRYEGRLKISELFMKGLISEKEQGFLCEELEKSNIQEIDVDFYKSASTQN